LSRSLADDAAVPLSCARARAAVRQGRMAAPNSALPKISPLAGKLAEPTTTAVPIRPYLLNESRSARPVTVAHRVAPA
jgi:hypothetical protein